MLDRWDEWLRKINKQSNEENEDNLMHIQAYVIVNSKSFKYALSLFKGSPVNLVWMQRHSEREVVFNVPWRGKVLKEAFDLQSFNWGDSFSILNINNFGYKQENVICFESISVSIPVICKVWDNHRWFYLSSSIIDKIIKVIPDEDVLMHFAVYTKSYPDDEKERKHIFIVIQTEKFSACIHGVDTVEGFYVLYR